MEPKSCSNERTKAGRENNFAFQREGRHTSLSLYYLITSHIAFSTSVITLDAKNQSQTIDWTMPCLPDRLYP